jgi:hypothetical protein
VFGDQQSPTATIAPREGLVQATNGSTAIGYGAIISFYVPQQQKDLQSTTDDLVAMMHEGNADMKVVSSSQRARVGGADGLITILESASPYGGTESDALVTVARPEGLFYLVFVSPSKYVQDLQGTFQQMMNSIQFAN